MDNELRLRTITACISSIIFWGVFLWLPSFFFTEILIFLLLWTLIVEYPRVCNLKQFSSWLFMLFYPLLPFLILIYFSCFQKYKSMLGIFFLSIFCFDTGAYIIGRTCGKRVLFPHISPHKTLEGCIGGFFFVCYCLIVLAQFFPFLWHKIIYISSGISISATSGDFFESYLKRRAHIKDTGSILPGHGGILDRFDSILFSSYFLCGIYLIHAYFFRK